MRYYEASSTIGSSPDGVWAALTDGAAWSTWDSGVDRVEGKIASGETITIRSKVAPGRAFPVKVTAFEPGRRLQFSGGMPLGLFKGVRTYTLTPDGGSTAFRMREEYTGPLLGMMWRSMPDLGPSFRPSSTGSRHAWRPALDQSRSPFDRPRPVRGARRPEPPRDPRAARRRRPLGRRGRRRAPDQPARGVAPPAPAEGGRARRRGAARAPAASTGCTTRASRPSRASSPRCGAKRRRGFD